MSLYCSSVTYSSLTTADKLKHDVSLQGDFPWDEKDFRYMAVTVAGVSSILLYFYFRDSGREITWKEFVHRYLGRGVVRTSLCEGVQRTFNGACGEGHILPEIHFLIFYMFVLLCWVLK